MTRASVVIPTYDGAELLWPALRSLRAQTWSDFEVIVVDNGSTDGTCERLASEFPEVRLLALGENRGFAPAVNEGIRAASGDVVVLLNNDTEAEPGWLEALMRALEAHPEVGFCASKMLQYHDRARIDSAGDQLGLFASQIGHGSPDGPAFARPRYVLAACAGAAAYRRSMLDEIGLLDDRYFAYFEDVDLACRANLAGWRGLYVPDAVVYHHGSATSDRMPERKFYLLMRNALVLFFQYAPPRRLIWSPVVVAWPFLRALGEGQRLRVAARAVLDFARDLPGVRRARRHATRHRRISWREMESRLAPPLTFQPSGHAPATRVGRALVLLRNALVGNSPALPDERSHAA